jgi:hypothetical protein
VYFIVRKRLQGANNVSACDLAPQFGSFGLRDGQAIYIALVQTPILVGILIVADTVQNLFLVTTEAFFALHVSDVYPDIYLVSIAWNRELIWRNETCDARPIRGVCDAFARCISHAAQFCGAFISGSCQQLWDIDHHRRH